jgi:hypothetical protein
MPHIFEQKDITYKLDVKQIFFKNYTKAFSPITIH